MILVGAKGHAREVYQLLESEREKSRVCFFDNVSKSLPERLNGREIIRSLEGAKKELSKDKRFVLALGGARARHSMYEQFREIGGIPSSVISETAVTGRNAELSEGLNVMAFAAIYDSAKVGRGVLVNSHASVHHDSTVGSFAEISPGARVLGRAQIGELTSIGSNAAVLPDVSVGRNCVVGAGAVVTQDVPDGETVVGVPAEPIR